VLVGPAVEGVDQTRHEFLAGSRFADDEDRGVREPGDLHDLAQQGCPRRALSDQVAADHRQGHQLVDDLPTLEAPFHLKREGGRVLPGEDVGCARSQHAPAGAVGVRGFSAAHGQHARQPTSAQSPYASTGTLVDLVEEEDAHAVRTRLHEVGPDARLTQCLQRAAAHIGRDATEELDPGSFHSRPPCNLPPAMTTTRLPTGVCEERLTRFEKASLYFMK